jgi:hypothetical protein
VDVLDVLAAVESSRKASSGGLQSAHELGLIWPVLEGWRLTSEGTRMLREFEAEVAAVRRRHLRRIDGLHQEGWKVYAHNTLDPDVSPTFDSDGGPAWTLEQAEEALRGLGSCPESEGHRLWLESPGGERFRSRDEMLGFAS